MVTAHGLLPSLSPMRASRSELMVAMGDGCALPAAWMTAVATGLMGFSGGSGAAHGGSGRRLRMMMCGMTGRWQGATGTGRAMGAGAGAARRRSSLTGGLGLGPLEPELLPDEPELLPELEPELLPDELPDDEPELEPDDLDDEPEDEEPDDFDELLLLDSSLGSSAASASASIIAGTSSASASLASRTA